MAKIVGVKFRHAGKIYYFDPKNDSYQEGEGVIVETAKGVEYGTVALPVREVKDEEVTQPLKPVIRKANKKDEENRVKFAAKRPEAMRLAAEKIRQRGLDMKLIDCEYTFDGSKIIFYFTADGRVDFRELVRDLASAFRIRIELRQVGIRDEAKMLGGIAPCGRPCCCSSFLQDFKKVSIKMAKTQGLSLNPGKISGLCGRLMCCLEYENEYYSEVYKKMPKTGSEVQTPEGKGTVVSNNMLKLITRVKLVQKDGSEVYRDFPAADLKILKKEENRKGKPQKGDDEEKISDELKEILD